MSQCYYCEQEIGAPGQHLPGCVLYGSQNTQSLNLEAVQAALIAAQLSGKKFMEPYPAMRIPESAFTPCSDSTDPHARCLAWVQINGMNCHVEAIAVYVDANDIQNATDPEWQSALEQVYEAVGGDGGWQTITMFGREYVLILTPFCS
jgi:hypothetical protein